MGKLNSSKTRVGPIFKELNRRDATGKGWLPSLMRLGGRGAAPEVPGLLSTPPWFEFPAPPPRDFLEWLVTHPEKLDRPKYTTGDLTKQKRDKLLAKDPAVLQEAISAIKDPASDHQRKWWCFEGTSMVDCALFTPRLVLFVEGKRTEAGSSPDVSWYRGRDQVLRNLDCARSYARQRELDYYTMLIIEDGDKEREKKAREVGSSKCVASSLPHLTKTEQREIMQHYLGFTTWQAVVEKFDLPASLLL